MALTTLKPRIAVLEQRRAAPQPKVADGFYATRQWKEARALCIGLHGHRCVECGSTPRVLIVDHVVEIKDGGALLDQANLRPRCTACNTRKGIKARAARMARRT